MNEALSRKLFSDKYGTGPGAIPLKLIQVLFQFLNVTFVPPSMTSIQEIIHNYTH